MPNRFHRAITGARRFAVRRIALPILGTRPLRRGALALGRSRFRARGRLGGRVGGRLADRVGGLVDRALIAVTPDSTERERSTQALVELFFDLVTSVGVDVFVEAGAKEASASLRAVESGVTPVVAFEANPYTHKRFVASLTQAGVDYRHLALSDRSGDVTFLVRRREDGVPMADGQGSLLVRPDHEPGYEEVIVSAVTLDDELGRVDGRVAMWVDVEGAVAEVLGGAATVLTRADVVIIEVESVERWIGQRWLDSDVIEHLERFGLRAVGRDMQSRWQYNILFVRDLLLTDASVAERIAAWRRASPAGERPDEPAE